MRLQFTNTIIKYSSLICKIGRIDAEIFRNLSVAGPGFRYKRVFRRNLPILIRSLRVFGTSLPVWGKGALYGKAIRMSASILYVDASLVPRPETARRKGPGFHCLRMRLIICNHNTYS